MNIQRQNWLLNRRHFLRGAGAMVALPLLDCMRPARAAAADKVQAACSTPEYPARRLGEIRSQHAETPTVTLV